MKVGRKAVEKLPVYLKVYLAASKQAGDYLTGVIRNSIFRSEHQGGVGLMIGLCAWIMCLTLSGLAFQKLLTDLKLEKYKDQYIYYDTALPTLTFQNIGLECPDRRAHVVVAGDETVILTDVSIENESDSPIYINLAGSKPLRIRARLWNAQLRRYVQDGIQQSYNSRALVAPRSVFNTVLAISGWDINPALVGDDTFIDFGIVQEGVAWATMQSKCRFRVIVSKEAI